MTKTEVVNLALAKLGVALVVRLDDATIPGSHFGGLLYQPTLERVLREFPWSFATREESLAQLPEKKSSQYAYSYSLPGDYVRIREIPTDVRYIREEQFSRTGNHLNTDVSPVTLSYVSSEVVPDDLDPDFLDAFTVLLASELATPLLQAPQLAQSLKEEYLQIALPKAKATDARETQSRENHNAYDAIASSPLVQSRFRR